jgi:uncharacterized membrane protein
MHWRKPEPSFQHELAVPPSRRRVLGIAAGSLLLLTALGAVLLRPREAPPKALAEFLPSEFYDARIERIEYRPCRSAEAGSSTAPGRQLQCPRADVILLQGPDEGSTVTIDLPANPGRSAFGNGDKVVLAYSAEAELDLRYAFSDRQRKPVLFWLAVLFAVVVVALGRLRGFTALAGLAASLLVLLAFVLPAILDGRSPVLVAVVGSAVVAFLTLYLAHGFRTMTTVALLGTLASLALTAGLASVVTALASLSGYASEEATILQLAESQIDLAGLVLAGIVIGALGAIDDMTVTQVAAVAELHEANPELGRGGLYRAAFRIGRDHVASTVNTLALAYAGASIPLFLLLVLSRQSLGSVVNGEVVATEVVRTLVGSIGLVSSVPLTTWLAVRCTSSR